MRLSDIVFVCFDCEATGLDTESDRIIEIGGVRFTLNEELDSFEYLVDPERPISPESQKIHNISEAMVQGKPKIEELLPKVLDFIGNAPIVGHQIAFDVALVTQAAKRSAIPCSLENRKAIDTLRLARLYGQAPTNSLETLRAHFNLPPAAAHRALDDARVNVQVFKHLVSQFKTLEEVEKALAKPIPMKRMPLGKYKGRAFADVPEEYLRWALNKDFDQDLRFSMQQELKRRKRGGGFRQSSNPFQDL